MNGWELSSLEQQLIDEGWKKSLMAINREDFYLYKGYEPYKDEYDDTLYRYQIIIQFYDFRKYGERVEEAGSVNVIVMPLDIDDYRRADMHISRWDGLVSVERIASEYYEWVRKQFKCRDR